MTKRQLLYARDISSLYEQHFKRTIISRLEHELLIYVKKHSSQLSAIGEQWWIRSASSMCDFYNWLKKLKILKMKSEKEK